ncbi:uncharacterized protein LOC130165133 isoform X3 [Seriola aureovittata]|uniref:uncharacterized protein LOC130165133 isoform X3 n=1 Tax=Seriola aureovittata TaxID=2871759 RepID=UPI0024BE9A8B|nr:uncharacterized protein LOC130165133 isoform X3 [Seriola aureovittata]
MLQTFRKCAAYGLCSLSSLHADHFELQHQITNATRSHHSRLKYVPPPGDQDRHRPAHRSNSSSSPLALTCPSHRKLAATHHKRRITAQSAGLSSDRRLEHTSPGTLHLLFGAPPSHVQLTGPDAAGHTSAGLCLFQQLETKTERRGLELLSGASQKGKRARRGLEDWFCLATPLGVTCHTLTTAGRRRRLFLNITLNCVKTVTVCRAVHLRPAEEQVSRPGRPPAAAPQGRRPDPGPEGGQHISFPQQYLAAMSYDENAERPKAQTKEGLCLGE